MSVQNRAVGRLLEVGCLRVKGHAFGHEAAKKIVRTLPENIIYMHIGMVASIEHTHNNAVQTVMNEYKKQSH